MAGIQWKKVCCPVDFTESGRAGMKVAADLSGLFGAELTLLYVASRPPTVLQTPVADPESQLARWAREAERLGASKVRVALAAGEASTTIEEFARRNSIDLLVLGTHGRSDREHMLTGSVAEAVVRLAPCPVLVVRGEWSGAR